ncbi:Immunoglobulin-like domain of spore germination [Marininema mesophilum]|uniref:Immunoglobulin-like domain of spore germination n=1 Tax=Marininema mesophilum TaxID=1048340 RepID=A0A1H3BEG1_9BACL|nr:Gmad2 immunoglobulin-like domain-containing protein [Marininema mesophilum]SDX39784.1 Immunoglobulin-like domain of spore germination [Marininema mesophilum]
MVRFFRVGMLALMMVAVVGLTFGVNGASAKDTSAFRKVTKGSPSVEYVVSGKASVWEATYSFRVKDGSKTVSKGFGIASTGAPNWGDFKQVIKLPKSASALKKTLKVELYEESAKDGSEINKIVFPLKKGKFSGKNISFKDISIADPKVKYSFKGEAQVSKGVYHYVIGDGHDYVAVGSGKASADAPKWGKFSKSVSIPLSDVPVNGTLMLELYEKSPKDGQPIHGYLTPLDQLPWTK